MSVKNRPLKNEKEVVTSKKLKFLLVTFSVVAALLVGELFIRMGKLWVDFPFEERTYYTRSPIPGVPYTLKPDIDQQYPFGRLVTNKDGFRTRFTPEDSENMCKILVVGDSITFGFGVSQQQAFPQQLEKILNTYNKNETIKYKVINSGVNGYNAENEMGIIRHLVPKYHPDIIVWLLINNDWDDALSVNSNGQLDTSQSDYIGMDNFMQITWGWNRPFFNPQNFYESMDEAHQCWAVGKAYTPSVLTKLDTTVKTYSYLYAFLKSRISPSAKTDQKKKSGIIYKNPQVTHDGKVDFLPGVSPIRLSPFYNHRFYNAIRQGISQATENAIPIVIYGLDIPFDAARIPGNIVYEDISQYFGMPLLTFHHKYNLGWDGHLNPAGNRILAEAVARSLSAHTIIDKIDLPAQKFYDKSWYWEKFTDYQKEYTIRFIAEFINFKRFQNVHQLIGGLYPPRLFPIKKLGYISVILKWNTPDILYISGENLTADSQKIIVDIGMNGHSHSLDIEPGQFLKTIKITNDLKESYHETVIDVRMECPTELKEKIMLSYLGFIEPPGMK